MIFKNHNKHSKWGIPCLCLIALAMQSCQDKMETDEENNSSKVYQEDEQFKMGEKWELPYTLRNVQAAYDSLKAGNLLRSGEAEQQLQATHYYVRFLPKDSSDWAELLKDTNIILTEIPWDREVEGKGGESYHDPNMGKNVPTWQYTKVPIDYQFSNVKYEILDELCILPEFELSEDEEIEETLRSQTVPSFGKQLQMAALRRAGYIKEDDSTNALPLRSWLSKTLKKLDPTWTPKANIRAWDDLLGKYIPLKGVKVYINHGGVWYYRTTDKDGYVKFPTCVGPVVYKIEWSDTYWQIYDGYFEPAYYSRSGTNRSTWDLDISGGKSLHYACIHRAARRHLYENNCGIIRPYHFHRICYLDSEGTGEYWADMSAYAGGAIPDIRIYGYENGNYKPSYRVFENTTHELGHAQHCLGIGRINYWQVSKIIYESWAECVAWALCNQEYGELNATKNQRDLLNRNVNLQKSWPEDKKDKSYSPLFIDLVDDFNQREKYGSAVYPDDRISGYTMYRLNQVLNEAYGLSSLKANLKSSSKPSGVTDAKIDLLFKRYEEVWK